MADRVVKVKCMDIRVHLAHHPTPTNKKAFAATVFAGSAPTAPGNDQLTLAVSVMLGFVGAMAAEGIDVETEQFDRALRQVATHFVRSLGDPNFTPN